MNKKASILIIDDEVAIVKLLKLQLTRQNLDVDIALNARAGIACIEAKDYDFVLTDIRMDGASGIDVLNHIRKHNNGTSTKVIGMSGTPWAMDGCDFDATLKKPFPLHELIDIFKFYR